MVHHRLEVRIIAALLIVAEVAVLHHLVVAAILAEAVAVHAHPIAVAVVDHIHPVAAVEAVGYPCIIWDLGTATTVSVVDDKGAFIGIVTRSAIIRYCQQQLFPDD